MNKNIKKLIALAISATTVISAALSASAAEPKTTTGNGTSIDYTGKAITPDILLYDDDIQLIKDVDYELAYENNINVGTATIIVTFKGNYSGERRLNFNIIAKTLTQDDVVISALENQVFMGEPITPKPTVTFGDVTLAENTDYELSYTDNTSAGVATITINFKGNYSGTATANFEITAKNLTDDDTLVIIGGSIPAQTYTGDTIEPKPEITYGDKVLEEGKDYELSYENNTDVGEGKVKVEFKGDYSGEKEYTFPIVKKAITEDNTEITGIADTAYTGTEITPDLVITVDGHTLEADKDYTVTYENNINVGTAAVTIKFVGNYDGDMTREFNITPFVVTDDNVKISSVADQIYTGSEITPEITVTIVR